MRKLLFYILILMTTIQGSGQSNYGEVSIEELQSIKSASDKTAAAEIIYQTAKFDVEYKNKISDYKVTKQITVRLKIYDKDRVPPNLLKVEVPLRNTSIFNERISQIEVKTYNMTDNQIQVNSISKDDVYKEKQNDHIEMAKFAFPLVQNGSVIEYRYTIDSPIYYDLKTWYFQQTIPVRYSVLMVQYPKNFVYNKDMRGYVKEVNAPSFSTENNYDKITDKIIFQNIPAFSPKPFVLNQQNLKYSVRYELKALNNYGYTNHDFSSHWETIMQELYDSYDYGKKLRGNKFLDEELYRFDSFEDDKEKINAIFDFVKTEHTWNRHYGLYPDNGVRQTYKTKVGNGTDLNFLLISMLNQAGFAAYPIVLSTVSNGILNLTPSLIKLNHTITGVQLNDQLLLMDAVSPYSQINLLPEEDLNFFGIMMIKDDQYKKVSLINTITSTIKTKLHYTLEDNAIKGILDEVKTNYLALPDLKEAANNKNYKLNKKSTYNLDVLEFETSTYPQRSAIRNVLSFQDIKSIETIGDKIIFNPFIVKKKILYDFSDEERNFPLEFGSPFKEVQIIKIKIPETYQVESMPDDVTILLSNKVGAYSVKYENVDAVIIISSYLEVSQSILPPEYYGEVRKMYQKIIEKENQQVILKKL